MVADEAGCRNFAGVGMSVMPAAVLKGVVADLGARCHEQQRWWYDEYAVPMWLRRPTRLLAAISASLSSLLLPARFTLSQRSLQRKNFLLVIC